MIVMLLERVPRGVRGELTRWLLELRTGVFVGQVSGVVRETLWEMVCAKRRGGSIWLCHTAANEQGYVLRSVGEAEREIVDWDGLLLIRVKAQRPKAGATAAADTSATF